MFLAPRRIETYACWPNNVKVKICRQVKAMEQKSNFALMGQTHHFLLETNEIGQVDVHNTRR